METNGVMMQFFQWYAPNDGSLWRELEGKAAELAQMGISSLWIPPCYKGTDGSNDVGYGVYDLFDLGEFDQKGSVRTKYGRKEELLAAIKAAQAVGIQVYADTVFNHRMGGDAQEMVRAHWVNPDDRNQISPDLTTIQPWTRFDFAARGDAYSSLKLHWWHFDAVDMAAHGDYGIYLFEGKSFDTEVDTEKGNFDFLMGCDVDVDHPEVQKDLADWGEWFVNLSGIDGFRFDAAKHVEADFFMGWIETVSQKCGKDLFGVGEYWSYEVGALDNFLAETKGRIALFDVPLHDNFYEASRAGRSYDLRRIFDGSLVAQYPALAVTFVENHDTQPLQALESSVEPWFKPMAYALILLRRNGYPCIFYADYYGAHYTDKSRDITLYSHRWVIDQFLQARRRYGHGEQYDYFDYPSCVGWTRLGTADFPGGMAVLMSNSEAGYKWMDVGHPNTAYRDCTDQIAYTITTNAFGWAEFHCNGGAVSVWVPLEG